LDGVRRTSLVNNLPPVTALAVDQTENIVYWATPSSIEAIDINGNNRYIFYIIIYNKKLK
jgi:hypothetical protein